jgi:hypothetical protein
MYLNFYIEKYDGYCYLPVVWKFTETKSVEDCKALQVDINAVQQWCDENCMELSIQKTTFISFTHNTNSIHCKYYMKDVWILHCDCIKALGIVLDSKLYFHCQVNLFVLRH